MPARDNMSKPKQSITYVTFHVGNQTYALPITPVRQIIEMVTITPLPQVNHPVMGVINFHGVLAPVINMRRLMNLPDAPLTLHTPIILVNISERLIGLIVDDVVDVLQKPASDIIDPNKVLLKEMGDTPLIQGLIQTQDGSMLLLNPEQLLKSNNGKALTEAVDSLSQSLERDVTGKVKDPIPLEASLPVQSGGENAPNEPEVSAVAAPKGRRHKKTSPASEVKEEASA